MERDFMSKLKENTLNFIVLEAKKLFLSSSINDVKMKDIALSVGIGEATLYRYFEAKENIVMQVAVKMAEEIVMRQLTIRSFHCDKVEFGDDFGFEKAEDK